MPIRLREQRCVVPGCPNPGRNRLGARCRVAHDGETPFPDKSRTYALFSIESDAFLCDSHALGGGHLRLVFEPDGSQEAAIDVVSGENVVDERRKPIRQPMAA
jgi:hypothetical protein